MLSLGVLSMDKGSHYMELHALNGSSIIEHSPKIMAWMLDWEQNENYHSVDRLSIYCHKHSIIPTQEITKVIAEVAKRRMDGSISPSQENVAYKEAKESALLEMWKMIEFCKLTEDEAGINTLKILKVKKAQDNRIKTIKVSSLKRDCRVFVKNNSAWLRDVKNTAVAANTWTVEYRNNYLKQYALIQLESHDIGELR